MFTAGTTAAAAAGATGGGGLWLFSYNKENFGFDAGMRFGRFMMSRGFANAQVGQYREDIEGITGMTVTKMDAWQSVSTLFLAVAAALSCAGRIGMHGSAPPGWFCALFSGSIFASVLFNGLSLWLSMHASLRAQCAAVSLQTRKVRLPIPSTAQLDQARVFGSTFEKQETRDIFRVPFMQHAEDAPEMPSSSSSSPTKKGAKGAKGKKGKSSSSDAEEDFGSTSRPSVPSWIRDEVVLDKANGFPQDDNAELHDVDDAPQHFNLLMEAQKEWRDYDVYARISMLYGVISFLYAVTYYAVGTAICELRGFWVMWSIPIVFVVAQALILRLDILQNSNDTKLPNCEWLGHIAPYFAVAACSLEYRYYYSQAQVAITWGLVFAAFFGHFMMALRMLDLAWPSVSTLGEMPEEPAKQWWPASWAVPRAFSKNLWFITPPAKRQEGQACLVHEMEDMAAAGGGFGKGKVSAKGKKGKKAGEKGGADEQKEEATIQTPLGALPFGGDFGFKRSPELPWKLTRVAICTVAFQWFFMMIASGVEIVMGPETLLKPPGEPPWIRDTKGRIWTENSVHMSTNSALPEGYRLFAASKAHYEAGAAAGGHRRLAEAGPLDELLRTAPELAELLERIAAAPSSSEALPPPPLPTSFMAPEMKAEPVVWPSLFEPHHIAMAPAGRPGQVLALTRRGFGAVAPAGLAADAAPAPAAPFSIDGLNGHGAIVGTAWNTDGLLLATSMGKMLRCAGEPVDGVWSCAEASRLPLPQHTELSAAAIADGLVAIVFKHMPRAAVLYSQGEADEWHPSGEVHVPPEVAGSFGLNFADRESVLITAENGEVHRRHFGGVGRSSSSLHMPPQGASATHKFRAACMGPEGGLLRLALKQAAPGRGAWTPQLVAAEV